MIRGDGKTLVFLNGKSRASLLMRRKAANLNWTVLYRRLHKKGQAEESSKKRSRAKKVVATKPIEGASVEQIKAKRSQKPEVRKAARDAALREIKARNAGKKKAAPQK